MPARDSNQAPALCEQKYESYNVGGHAAGFSTKASFFNVR